MIETGAKWSGPDMLERIRSSLRATHYENGELVCNDGGDNEVFREVDRIVLEVMEYWTR